jgi:hypothetical protein
MLTRWEHARSIGPALAASLSELERRSLSPRMEADDTWDPERISHAIAETWQGLVDDAKSGQFDLMIPYLGRVHERLGHTAGTEAPGQFADEGRAGMVWSVTVSALKAACEGFDYSYLTDAVLLAQLRWGGDVRSMAFSLGWLCINGVWAISPPPADHDRLIKILGSAGPDSWDPESLRALLGEYTDSQDPR